MNEVCFETLSPNDTLVAIKNVPDLIEPVGCGFFKSKKYVVKSVRGHMVDVVDEYGNIDSFSTDFIHQGTNFLWDWFQKEV